MLRAGFCLGEAGAACHGNKFSTVRAINDARLPFPTSPISMVCDLAGDDGTCTYYDTTRELQVVEGCCTFHPGKQAGLCVIHSEMRPMNEMSWWTTTCCVFYFISFSNG